MDRPYASSPAAMSNTGLFLGTGLVGNDMQQASAGQKVSQVDSEISNLSNWANTIALKIESLEKRLSDVLVSVPPSPTSDGNRTLRPNLVSKALALAITSDSLAASATALSSILDRLEL